MDANPNSSPCPWNSFHGPKCLSRLLFFFPLWGKQSYEAEIFPIFLSHFLTFFRFAQSKIKYHVTTGNLGKICLIQHAVKIYSTLHWSWEISLTRGRKWAPCSLLVLISLHPPHKRRWQDQQVPPGKIDCLGIRQLTLRLVACFPQTLGHVIHFSYSKLLYYNLHRQYQGSPVESCWVLSSVILLWQSWLPQYGRKPGSTQSLADYWLLFFND